MNTSKDEEFLQAGICHFPDAYATVAAFRRLIAECAERTLRASRPDVWKPHRDIKPTKGETDGLWVGAGGPMVLSSNAAKQLVVDVGIWWNCPQLSVRTAA